MPTVAVDVLELALIGLVFLLSAIAIKVGVSFDINRWREERRRRAEERLRVLCTHTRLSATENEGVIRYESLMTSPPFRFDWRCSRCGQITQDRELPERLARYWCENPHEWSRREKAFSRTYRRLYRALRG